MKTIYIPRMIPGQGKLSWTSYRIEHFIWMMLATTALLVLTAAVSEGELELIYVKGKPVVEGTLNGKKAYFLLDTGSSKTILDREMLRNYGFKLCQGVNTQMVAIGGKSSSLKPVNGHSANIILGDYGLFTSIWCCNLGQVLRSLNDKAPGRIVGIIGADIMRTYGFQIDYANNKVWISARKVNENTRQRYQITQGKSDIQLTMP